MVTPSPAKTEITTRTGREYSLDCESIAHRPSTGIGMSGSRLTIFPVFVTLPDTSPH